jgi:hypothetical protein
MCGSAPARPLQRGLSKGVKYGRRLPAMQAGHSQNGHKAVSGVVHPQGIKGSGMEGPGETLASLWIPLAMRTWRRQTQLATICENGKGTVTMFSKSH